MEPENLKPRPESLYSDPLQSGNSSRRKVWPREKGPISRIRNINLR